jgi:hypothetical protein
VGDHAPNMTPETATNKVDILGGRAESDARPDT